MQRACQPLVSEWCRALLGLFYPNLCQICRVERSIPAEGYVCQACASRPGAVQLITAPYCERCGLPFSGDITTSFQCSNCQELKLHFQYARAVAAARGLVLDVIHRFKYHRSVWFEPFLAKLLVDKASPTLLSESWDLIIPVPLHSVKQREREFNQAERLARHLARATHLPMDTHLLRRLVPTRTQTLLTRRERADNVSGAFAMRAGRRLSGERVVLIDDVFTTGATTNECAKVLRRNGSAEVCVWTVARGL